MRKLQMAMQDVQRKRHRATDDKILRPANGSSSVQLWSAKEYLATEQSPAIITADHSTDDVDVVNDWDEAESVTPLIN